MQPYQEKLRPRENELLASLMGGSTTYAEIAQDMTISVKSVQSHLMHIYQVLDIHNMTELVLWCVCNGYKAERKHRSVSEQCYERH